MSYPAAGKLNRKISLQSVARSKDADGIVSEVWTTYATPWASIRYGSASEASHDKGIIVTSKVTFEIRYHAEVTESDRVSYNSRTFQINSVTDVDEAHAQMLLECTEIISGG